MKEYQHLEIGVRCYPEIKNSKTNRNRSYKYTSDTSIPNRILIFDTETTIDEYQNLQFGYFEIYNRDRLEYKGIFYNPSIRTKDLKVLKDYCNKQEIELLKVRDFVESVFLPEVYDLKTLCVGFNLPFDLSRIAISFGNARGKNKGGFSFKLSNNPLYPRLVIKHIDNTKSFIQFGNSPSRKLGNNRHRKNNSYTFRGNFLDLRTLSFALTNKKHTLRSACEQFKTVIKKTESKTHGKITTEYIEYCINDVKSTYSLYMKLEKAYSEFNLDTPITKIYSPASIGKAYLKAMNILNFSTKNPNFPKDILGYIMATYYGGRSEIRERKTPKEINLIDFLSMYPTVNILQSLWKFVICDHIEYFDDTENIQEFIDSITLEKLQDKDTWNQLQAIVLIEPNEDILPIRSKYGDKYTFNIGLNYLTSETSFWYTLSDIIGSKLLTRKTPKVIKGIRFKPVGIQKHLREIEIIGNKKINPVNDDLFKTLIEYRKEMKKENNDIQYEIKIVTNATSYGIFAEINTENRNDIEMDVYGLDNYTIVKDKVERFGSLFNPLIATFTTSGSRLILAITESILKENNSDYVFCDTDSMGINPNYTEMIQEYFQPLNPYSGNEPLFKLEPENFNKDNSELETLHFYGISAKRYVLYNLINGKPVIRKYSSHGLGHILNPFPRTNDNDQVEYWHESIWYDILNEHYKLEESKEIYDKYSNRYAVSQLTISTTNIMDRLKKLNRNRSYDKQIKPFNFILVGITNQRNPDNLEPIKPLKSFEKKYWLAPYGKFIDYHSGNEFDGIDYWKPMDEIYYGYKNHVESKFGGKIGTLKRLYIKPKNIIHLGKESNKLTETQILGVNQDSYVQYYNSDGSITDKGYLDWIIDLKPKECKPYGISKKQLHRMKKRIRMNKRLKLSSKIELKLDMLFERYSKPRIDSINN